MTGAEREQAEANIRAQLDAGALDAAAERALRSFGAEILGWLHGTLRELDADEAYGQFAEELWRSLGRFDGRCSMRTWCYVLARHAASRVASAPAAGRAVPLSQAPLGAVAAEIRASTLPYLRTAVKEHVRALRAELSPEDQDLLVLRVDRDLGWRDIAHVQLGLEAAPAEVERLAATLRKRFERIKQRLRERLTPA